jgi:hypothetical protein
MWLRDWAKWHFFVCLRFSFSFGFFYFNSFFKKVFCDVGCLSLCVSPCSRFRFGNGQPTGSGEQLESNGRAILTFVPEFVPNGGR